MITIDNLPNIIFIALVVFMLVMTLILFIASCIQNKINNGKKQKCQGWGIECKRSDAVRYRMNTAYVNDEDNYKTLCPKCQESSDYYWQERWEETY